MHITYNLYSLDLSCGRIVYINVKISRDIKFSNWRLCDTLSFFKVVVNARGKDGVGDKDDIGGEDNIGDKDSAGGEGDIRDKDGTADKDNIGDRGSIRDKRSLVVILVTFITLLNHPLYNYRYSDG